MLAGAVSLASVIATYELEPSRLEAFAEPLRNAELVLYGPTYLVSAIDPSMNPWTNWFVSGVNSILWAIVILGAYTGIGALMRRGKGA
jgi:hypothetical protein